MKLENMNNAYANKKCTNNIYINNRYTIEVTRKRIKNMYLRVKDTDGRNQEICGEQIRLD